MKLAVIGAGYVGLVTGLCLAENGNQVVFVDTDTAKVKAIENKTLPIFEEGLGEILRKVDNIKASTSFTEISDCDVFFVCVGTSHKADCTIQLDHIEKAVEGISDILRNKQTYTVVCVKSTVAPGNTEDTIIPILEKSGKKTNKHFGVCMSPEFLREGKAVQDFMNPARIIIGESDKKAGDVLLSLFNAHFKAPVLRTDLRTAEMIKLASNAFLAAKISFANELGNICKLLDIDVYSVVKGMGLDERIGDRFLNAGVGFGGSCLPKDLRGLIARANELGYTPRILQEVWNVNEEQPHRIVELLKKHVTLKGATIGILGLAFKPDTDDIRDSRAVNVVKTLLREGARIKANDPIAMDNFKKLFPQIEYVTEDEALKSNAVVILTEWQQYNKLDYTGKIVIDGRRVTKAKEAKTYEGICW